MAILIGGNQVGKKTILRKLGSVDSMTHKSTTLHIGATELDTDFEKMSDKAKLVHLKFLQNSYESYICVLDSTSVDSMKSMKRRLQAVVEDAHSKHLVMVIFANKQDLPKALPIVGNGIIETKICLLSLYFSHSH